MPVEITMPLTKLEQTVADARKNEQIMAAKVEEAKASLKAAKGAWEEAVGEVFRALDEMIADKRQPALPGMSGRDVDDFANDTNKATVEQPATVETTAVSVEIISPEVRSANFPTAGDPFTPQQLALPAVIEPAVTGAKHWRDLIVADAIDGTAPLFDTLAVFGVETMGQLADKLLAGSTFSLPASQVHDLWELIEEASADDAVPIRFDREKEVAVTVKEQGEIPGSALNDGAPLHPEPEPEKAAKKPRGRKPKAKVEDEAESGPAVPAVQPSMLDDL